MSEYIYDEYIENYYFRCIIDYGDDLTGEVLADSIPKITGFSLTEIFMSPWVFIDSMKEKGAEFKFVRGRENMYLRDIYQLVVNVTIDKKKFVMVLSHYLHDRYNKRFKDILDKQWEELKKIAEQNKNKES